MTEITAPYVSGEVAAAAASTRTEAEARAALAPKPDWADLEARTLQSYLAMCTAEEGLELIADYLRLAHASGVLEGIDRIDADLKEVFSK